jgi:hypothetical protein
MNEEKKKALKVINARTKRLLDELEIEKEDMLDEPRIAYLMQEIRANKTLLNIIEKLQKENEELKFKERRRIIGKYGDTEIHDVINKTLSNDYISAKKIKDKIEELKINLVNMQGEELLIYESKIDILQELLGESEN